MRFEQVLLGCLDVPEFLIDSAQIKFYSHMAAFLGMFFSNKGSSGFLEMLYVAFYPSFEL